MTQGEKGINAKKAGMKIPFVSLIERWLNTRNLFGIPSKDRYKSLKMRIVLLDAVILMIPLIIMATVSYFWFQNILKDDYCNQLRWQLENTKQSTEFFVEEKLSGLRFLSSSYSYEQLSDEKVLAEIFSKFKKECGGLVDIGVIDLNGFQKAYVGPYHLQGKDYSNQDWFHEVVIRSAYVSDVFMGYRKLPHFAIAVRREVPEKGIFWILRATIDMHALRKYASAITLRDNDDAFIVTHEGVLQTPSRFHGKVLEKISLPVALSQEGVSLRDIAMPDGSPAIFGNAAVKDSPWVLVTIIKSKPYLKIPKIFRNELFIITVLSIIFSIFVTIALAQTVVNRIKRTDQELEQAIETTEHASKLASVGRLAAGVAHEINNPLAIINEKAGLMKDILETSGNIQGSKDKFLGLLNGIFESVNRCRTITHRLLGFSRRMDVSHDAIDLNEAIKEVIGFIEKEILYRNIVLTLNLKEDLPKVVADRGQIQQVFLNIIHNAVDAVEEGGQIEISSNKKDEKTVRVAIRDNGMGIPKEKIKQIFEPFYTTKGKGKAQALGFLFHTG